MTKSQFLQYTPPNSGAPLSFVITEFHALLLYADHVKGISLLNHELVFEDVYNEVQFSHHCLQSVRPLGVVSISIS
jgi:hypothetical protein